MKIQVNHPNKNYSGYRSNRVSSLFNSEDSSFHREFDIPLEKDDWSIGLIVGPSGSGKTSIGKKLFSNLGIRDLYQGWKKGIPIVEQIGPNCTFNQVTGALASVGLGDVPSWLKPFENLSNGQKFRAGLAKVILDSPERIIIDEFTSVVDRQIAKVGAMSFGKAWRNNCKGQVVLLSCHYDVIEWLQPDWVLDTSTGEVKKKSKSNQDQSFSWRFEKSVKITGSTLKSITI